MTKGVATVQLNVAPPDSHGRSGTMNGSLEAAMDEDMGREAIPKWLHYHKSAGTLA